MSKNIKDSSKYINFFKSELSNSIDLIIKIKNNKSILDQINKSIISIVEAIKNGNKILLAGNGGSAAESQHIAAEYVGRFNLNRKSMPAIALTTDTSIITSVGNDFGFDKIFQRQIQAFGKKNDIFIAYSTSGKSKNIINALKEAKKKQLMTISFIGSNGANLKEYSDLCIRIPSTRTDKIQECHNMIGHLICNLVEKSIIEKI